MLLVYFLQGVALALPTTILPSPFKIFLISQSLVNGWRHTLPAALVPLVTDGPILVLALFVLTQIPAWFTSGLRVAGGFFILYIAWRTARLLRASGPTLQASAAAARQSFRQAIGINLLNPNPYILWGVVAGPIVLEAWRQESAGSGLSFVAGFYIAFILGLATLVLVFGTVGKLSPRLNRALNGLAAVTLAALGFYQIYIGARTLLYG